MLVETDDVAGIFSAQVPALGDELLEHVSVADPDALENDAGAHEGVLEAEIAHQRADDAARQHAAPLVVARDHVEELIAVVDDAGGVDHHEAIAVAVEPDSEIGAVALHFFDEQPRIRCAAIGVDVHAVRRVADGHDVGAELVEHRRRDVIARAMRAIDDQPDTAQVELRRKRALAEFDVAAGGVVDAARLAKLRRRRARERHFHRALDFRFDGVRQLGAGRRKKLDAVVVERIMRSADHDARGEAQRARQIGDSRGGQRAAQIDIDARGGESGLERSLEQIAGDSRVLADQYAGPLAAPRAVRRGQRTSGRPAELQDDLGGDRRLAHATANAVGTEIVSLRHDVASFPSSIARQTFSASTVSLTSWTRTIDAPCATAESAAARLAASLSSDGRPVNAPSVDLRERPATTG